MNSPCFKSTSHSTPDKPTNAKNTCLSHKDCECEGHCQRPIIFKKFHSIMYKYVPLQTNPLMQSMHILRQTKIVKGFFTIFVPLSKEVFLKRKFFTQVAQQSKEQIMQKKVFGILLLLIINTFAETNYYLKKQGIWEP